MGFGVWGLGFGVWGLRCWVRVGAGGASGSLGFTVWVFEFSWGRWGRGGGAGVPINRVKLSYWVVSSGPAFRVSGLGEGPCAYIMA